MAKSGKLPAKEKYQRASTMTLRTPPQNPNKRLAMSPLTGEQEDGGILEKRLEKIEVVLESQVKTVKKLQPFKLDEQIGQLHNNLDFLKRKVDSLENYSRRANLVFRGIKEDAEESWEQTEAKVIEVVQKYLDFEPTSVARSHQLEKQGRRYRPVTVKFDAKKEKKMTLANRRKFKSSEIFVDEDFSNEIRQRRFFLFKEAKKRREAGNVAIVKSDKLKVNNVAYQWDERQQKIVQIQGRVPMMAH
uniref:Uncharacterized protein n=1 Tax=Strigamia maritima TaxID=126957 RepID=T1IXY9_STRMM